MPIPNLESVALGTPITRLGVSFIPVYSTGNSLPEIGTGAASGLVISELESRIPSSLDCSNPTARPILMVQGEQLVGGDQNRTLNVSVLIPPGENREIPVSCLEAGRWGERRDFARGTTIAPNSVRMTLLRSVRASVRGSSRTRGSDQSAVWGDVQRELRLRGVSSATQAMTDAEEVIYRDSQRMNAINEMISFGPLPGQCGIVVARGNRAVCADIMGSPNLFASYWGPLVRAHLSEQPSAVNQGRWDHAVGPALRLIRRMGRDAGPPQEAVGLGREFHVTGRGYIGQALTLWNSTVHASAYFTGS